MTTHHIGRIVIGCLAAGLVVALALVVGPLAGAQEHVITGTVLLAFASSWALLAALSMLWTDAASAMGGLPAGFMGLAGAGLLAFAPGGVVIDALGWVWPPLLLALARGDRRSRPPGSAQSHAVLGRVSAAGCLRAVRSWRGLSNHPGVARPPHACGARPVGRRRRTSASPELCRIGYSDRHPRIRPWRDWRVLGMDLGRGRARYEGVRLRPRGSRLERSALLSRRTASPSPRTSTSCSIAAHVPGPFVLVGHSSGAQYVRIFAGRYPEQVAGMVLLDGQPAEAFEGLPSFPAFYSGFRRVFALLPSLARLGVGRLVSRPLTLPDMRCLVARPQPARRVRRVADLACAGTFVSEPRRPAAGRRDRCARTR